MRLVISLAALVLFACGSSNGSPAPAITQIQLTAAGASPAAINIASGGQVDFVNKDTADHQITSPCSELISPKLTTGKDFSATLTGPKTCGFSDALNPGAATFKGTVTVAPPGGSDAGY